MKKISLLSRFFFLVILIASSVSFLYSCQKTLDTPSPAAPSPFEALRVAFNDAGYEQALNQSFGDSAKLYWEPNWHAAYTKTAPSGTVYTYVPLTPNLRSLRRQQRTTKFHMVGTQRFIIAKSIGDKYFFDLATYTVAQPKETQAATKRQTFAEAAAQPVLYASFSGKLVLRGLTVDEHAVFTYQNGTLVKPKQQLATARGNETSATSATNSDKCVTIYTCYWQAFCTDRNGNPETYGTMTQGIDGCDSPGQEACGIDNWGYSWDSNGYDTDQSCTYVEDPPNPNDPPTGGGSVGGDTGDDGTLSPTDVFIEPPVDKILDVKEYMKCFNTSQSASLSVYVDQPKSGTRKAWTGIPGTASFDVGHTFISIKQGNTIRVIGFYPATTMTAGDIGKQVPSVLADDSDHTYNIRIDTNLSPSQLQSLLNYITSYGSSQYSLGNYNCTDFSIGAAAAAGLTLPDTTGSWLGGSGSDPGDLGEDIRGMSPPPSGSIDTNLGQADSFNGTC